MFHDARDSSEVDFVLVHPATSQLAPIWLATADATASLATCKLDERRATVLANNLSRLSEVEGRRIRHIVLAGGAVFASESVCPPSGASLLEITDDHQRLLYFGHQLDSKPDIAIDASDDQLYEAFLTAIAAEMRNSRAPAVCIPENLSTGAVQGGLALLAVRIADPDNPKCANAPLRLFLRNTEDSRNPVRHLTLELKTPDGAFDLAERLDGSLITDLVGQLEPERASTDDKGPSPTLFVLSDRSERNVSEALFADGALYLRRPTGFVCVTVVNDESSICHTSLPDIDDQFVPALVDEIAQRDEAIQRLDAFETELNCAVVIEPRGNDGARSVRLLDVPRTNGVCSSSTPSRRDLSLHTEESGEELMPTLVDFLAESGFAEAIIERRGGVWFAVSKSAASTDFAIHVLAAESGESNAPIELARNLALIDALPRRRLLLDAFERRAREEEVWVPIHGEVFFDNDQTAETLAVAYEAPGERKRELELFHRQSDGTLDRWKLHYEGDFEPTTLWRASADLIAGPNDGSVQNLLIWARDGRAYRVHKREEQSPPLTLVCPPTQSSEVRETISTLPVHVPLEHPQLFSVLVDRIDNVIRSQGCHTAYRTVQLAHAGDTTTIFAEQLNGNGRYQLASQGLDGAAIGWSVTVYPASGTIPDNAMAQLGRWRTNNREPHLEEGFLFRAAVAGDILLSNETLIRLSGPQPVLGSLGLSRQQVEERLPLVRSFLEAVVGDRSVLGSSVEYSISGDGPDILGLLEGIVFRFVASDTGDTARTVRLLIETEGQTTKAEAVKTHAPAAARKLVAKRPKWHSAVYRSNGSKTLLYEFGVEVDEVLIVQNSKSAGNMEVRSDLTLTIDQPLPYEYSDALVNLLFHHDNLTEKLQTWVIEDPTALGILADNTQTWWFALSSDCCIQVDTSERQLEHEPTLEQMSALLSQLAKTETTGGAAKVTLFDAGNRLFALLDQPEGKQVLGDADFRLLGLLPNGENELELTRQVLRLVAENLRGCGNAENHCFSALDLAPQAGKLMRIEFANTPNQTYLVGNNNAYTFYGDLDPLTATNLERDPAVAIALVDWLEKTNASSGRLWKSGSLLFAYTNDLLAVHSGLPSSLEMLQLGRIAGLESVDEKLSRDFLRRLAAEHDGSFDSMVFNERAAILDRQAILASPNRNEYLVVMQPERTGNIEDRPVILIYPDLDARNRVPNNLLLAGLKVLLPTWQHSTACFFQRQDVSYFFVSDGSPTPGGEAVDKCVASNAKSGTLFAGIKSGNNLSRIHSYRALADSNIDVLTRVKSGDFAPSLGEARDLIELYTEQGAPPNLHRFDSVLSERLSTKRQFIVSVLTKDGFAIVGSLDEDNTEFLDSSFWFDDSACHRAETKLVERRLLKTVEASPLCPKAEEDPDDCLNRMLNYFARPANQVDAASFWLDDVRIAPTDLLRGRSCEF